MKSKSEYNKYMRDYMRERWNKRRERAIAMLGGKCAECGGADDLQFDHIDPATKSFTIAKRSACSEEKLVTELKKCQLLCWQCHWRKSVLERGLKIAKGTHGTLSSYKHCRCNLCRKANSEYTRNQRALYGR